MMKSWLSIAFAAGCAVSLGAAPLRAAGPPPASAPEGPAVETGGHLTLDRAVRVALERNPLIQMAQHDVEASDAVTKQIESGLYPQLTGVWNSTGGNTRVLANLNTSGSLPKPTLYLTTPGLRLDQLITDFGRTAHQVLANKSMTESAEKRVLTTKAVVMLDVQQAYLRCLKHEHLVNIAREILKAREAVRVQAETLYRHQLRSKLDLEFATVETQRAEALLLKAKNDLEVAFAHLNQAMGLGGADHFELEEVATPITPAEPIEPLLDLALAQRPELLGSKDRIRAAEEALKAAKALRFGQVTGIGTLAYTWWSRDEYEPNGSVKNPGKQLGWWGAGVTSAFPLYTGERIRGQIEAAEARKGQVDSESRSIANDVVLQVIQAYLTRRSAEQETKLAAERVDKSRESLGLARERYKLGLGSILEVMTATADLLAAEVGLTDARYNYRISEAALAYATGAGYGTYESDSGTS